MIRYVWLVGLVALASHPVFAFGKKNLTPVTIEVEDSSFGKPDYVVVCKTPASTKEIILARSQASATANVSKTLSSVDFQCTFKFQEAKVTEVACAKLTVPIKNGLAECNVLLELNEDTFTRQAICRPQCSTR